MYIRDIKINLTKKAKKIHQYVELVDKPAQLDSTIHQNPGNKILYRLKRCRSGTRSGARLTTSEVDKVITLTDYL